MGKTSGLLYILPVKDLDAAARYYTQAFGLEEQFRNDQIVFVGIPGGDSAIGLLLDRTNAGSGPQNIGLHLDHAINRDDVLREIVQAGGKIIEQGEHAPDVPFARVADPDGNVLEV